MVRRRPDPAQGFFDLRMPQATLPGLGGRLRDAIAETLVAARDRGMDRHAVAAEMSRVYPDCEIGKPTLDKWCAPGAAQWRFPAEALPALVRATGDARALMVIVEACDHRAIPTEAAALGELMILEMQEQQLKARKANLRASLTPEALAWATRETERKP